MDNGKKVKWRTKHKFGKSRKKKKNSVQPENVTESVTVADTFHSSEESDRDIETTASSSRPTTSQRKIESFKRKLEESEDEEIDREEVVDDVELQADASSPSLNMIINLGCLQSLMKTALCPHCNQACLTAEEGGPPFRMGSSCLVEVKCTTCGNVSTEQTSERTGISHTGFDVNRRIVAAATASGMGCTQTKSFFSLMGMPPPMSERMWYFYKGRLNPKVTEAADEHLQEAVREVRRVYADKGIGVTDNDGVLNIIVSVDGTWQKRGHKSHNGVVTLIEHHTGLIVDYVALSNYCHQCETGPKEGSHDYVEWYPKHRPKCQKNIDCGSGAMEMEGACILFCRSVEKNKLRYTQMLGDGDSKTHARIQEVDPYEGRPILKLECVNHVAKRLGSGLRDLKVKRSAQNRPIGGRGKLTDDRIKQLTGYYGSAIKQSKGDLEGMVMAVWASFYHVTSTDTEHNHDFCPEGRESWCFFKRAAADGVEPRPHSKSLPADVADAIRPLYVRLSDRSLLVKCLDGWTQNNNECFHSVLWALCPKVKWASLKTVDTCLALAIQRFNKGSSSNLDLLKKIEIKPSKDVGTFADQQDYVRVKGATRKSSTKEKERRQKIDAAQRAERQARQEREGAMYGAGQF